MMEDVEISLGWHKYSSSKITHAQVLLDTWELILVLRVKFNCLGLHKALS